VICDWVISLSDWGLVIDSANESDRPSPNGIAQPQIIKSNNGLPMTLLLEREVKLRFDTPDQARDAVLAAGASPLRCRRLQEDCLLDTEDEMLRRRRCVLRIRT
jgi:hypothetical protein